MNTNSNPLDASVYGWRSRSLPETIANRTRRVYDRLAVVYPLSTRFFHRQAHQAAEEICGIQDGMRVLEAATGSGEMFRRLVRLNPHGQTLGFDLSPNMAARTQRDIRRAFPSAATLCGAVDARYVPFASGSFDAVVCCYLLELLGAEDIHRALREFHRILRPGGRFTLVMIGQNRSGFNRMYRLAGAVAPAFWGRQVDSGAESLLKTAGFSILAGRTVQQGYYPSRVLAASR